MSFIIDKQTLNDLEIPGKKGKRAVQSLFNFTKTKGGAEQLDELFQYPLASVKAIKERVEVFEFFHEQQLEFPISVINLDLADQYLQDTDERSLLVYKKRSLAQNLKEFIQPNSQIQLQIAAIKAVVNIGKELEVFLDKIAGKAKASSYQDVYAELMAVRGVIPDYETTNWAQLTDLDRYFRFEKREKLKRLLYLIYSLDVNITVAEVAKANRLTFPKVQDDTEPILEIVGLRHPLLSSAVPNDIAATADKNLIFLTGVNMAGKSTFMKSFGIAIFLAHIGFPVPASKMTFSVFDGLLTTINLSDNLSIGHSHFYAEVVRIRKMAEYLQKGKRMVLIVDELFRGTNVKDAFDATVAITSALSKKNDSIFMISTHIIEAGEKLRPLYPSISFICLSTSLKDGKPFYNYKIQKGITEDRHGMLIVQNEGILDILNQNQDKI
jgi:DNA mismatch repair protein MutS